MQCRWPAAKSMSSASVDLSDPDGAVSTTSESHGTSRSTPLRLCWPAKADGVLTSGGVPAEVAFPRAFGSTAPGPLRVAPVSGSRRTRLHGWVAGGPAPVAAKGGVLFETPCVARRIDGRWGLLRAWWRDPGLPFPGELPTFKASPPCLGERWMDPDNSFAKQELPA